MTPTTEQIDALVIFATANGRSWKAHLRHCWEAGCYSQYPGTQRQDLLQQIRNQFGPTWLTSFSFKTLRTSKPCKAIRLTERDLKRLDDEVEKAALAIGARFGECDEALVRMADYLLRMTREWADELREYMNERAADGESWEL